MPSFVWQAAQAAQTAGFGGLAAIALAVVLASTVGLCVYRLWWHPLAAVPGPWLAACSSLWLGWHSFIGDECSAVFRLHERYGPVLRVGPNDVDISDASAIGPIYVERGGFAKTTNYNKFNVDGHTTLFSSLTRDERLPRVRAVAPLFSTASIRKAEGETDGAATDDATEPSVLVGVVNRFVACVKLHAEHSRQTGRPVNVLSLGRSMALDAVSTYLFQQPYGALDELAAVARGDKKATEFDHGLSAAPFVDAFVGVGAFFNLHVWFPGWDTRLMELIDRVTGTMTNAATDDAFATIDTYTARLVKTATPGSGSYVSRLLTAGAKAATAAGLRADDPRVWRRHVQAECKDVCFAGTDSSGMNIAMMLWQLSRHRGVYARLRTELASADPASPPDITNAYLRGVVRESLRLSWAAPTRLPRVVPAAGWTFGGYHFPAGAAVGVASFQLHQDPDVFPDPTAFRPERWLQPTEQMLSSFFAFGRGGRACIGQNLAMSELLVGTARLVQEDALRGASTVHERVDILEWFNSRVKGEEVLVQFA